MYLLHDASLPGTAGLYAAHPTTTPATPARRKHRKSQSHGSLLSPLVRLVRRPAETIEHLIGAVNNDARADGLGEPRSESRRQVLYLRLKNAATYDDWRAAASELDRLEGNDAWKAEPSSPEYDVALVAARLQQLDDARISCDVGRMLFLVRTSLARGLGGMGDLRLYKHAHIGTKALIERYIESARATLAALLDASTRRGGGAGLEPRYVLEQLLAARQAFGRSALLLSGGGTFGMNHIGVVKSLFQARLLPRIISGSSAGSIVCAALCTKTDAEIPAVLDQFCYGDLAVFEERGNEDGVLVMLARFLKFGALFDISHLTRVMRDVLGDITFQEAYNRTRRILNICVSSASLYELPRLLNYVTAPNVIIWSAVAASCSVPFVFSAASLLAKDPKTGESVPWNPSPQRWIDGSVDNDLPMTRLAEMFNVNHFIVSQVNPHVVPFLAREEDDIAGEAQRSTSAVAAGPSWMHTMANLAKGEALHRMHVLAELGVFPNYFTKMRSILSQRYSGDITILPEVSYTQFPRVLKNPTTDFMQQATICGERATWPRLSRIQNHCAIELALDDAVQQLRARVVFSPSQVDLRLNAFGRPASRAGSDLGTDNDKQPTKLRHRPSRSTDRSATPSNIRLPRLPPSNNPVPALAPPAQTPRFPPPVPHLRIPAAEVLSSSAEDGTDARSASSESDEPPSSTDSPPSPSLPELWPSTRQLLFPSASQPATPSAASRQPLGSSPPPAPALALSMTPGKADGAATAGPSSPEIRYRRLFHPPGWEADGAAGEGGRGRRDSAAGTGHGLRVDLSGTRGMVLRRKRSLSTGVRGLKPPVLR